MKLTARFVVPGDAPSICGGAIQVRDGKIVAVGPGKEVGGGPVLDYGDAVIMPGFVNAHTHLELSFLAGKVRPGLDFVDWLRRLVQALAVQPPTREDVEGAVRQGIAQSLSFGVTTVGDITRWPTWTRPVLARSPLRAVSFGEVIAVGPSRSRLAERLELAASQECRTGRLRCGISPHSPYTVEPDALRVCARRAHELAVRMCIHVAESMEEASFTLDAGGRLASFLQEVGAWDEQVLSARCGPIEGCHKAGILGDGTLLAHANYVSDDDLALIAKSGASVVYCPRTHAAFGHPPHRFRDMLRSGINVCVGTDSLASNPSLSILDELRFVRERHPDVDAGELLRMGTLRGAAALGLDEEVGSITVGKAADLVVIPLEVGRDGLESVLESSAMPSAVYIDGAQTSFAG